MFTKRGNFISQQYTLRDRSVSQLISEEINNLKENFDNEKRRIDGMDTVNRIATLNLCEYEDALNRAFQTPEKV
ncbi:MAG: hypothetical protein KAX49_14480 [Halanaerobiales bacterium]|nr:hypothetical protein [Halanaerobiales bacterium]